MPEDKDFEQYLERRAEQLGLPTDPEAYQDGELAEAAVVNTVQEAQLLAFSLKRSNIPAWVEGENMALAEGIGYPPRGLRVLVPLGRLADARRLIEQAGRTKKPPSAGHHADWWINRAWLYVIVLGLASVLACGIGGRLMDAASIDSQNTLALVCLAGVVVSTIGILALLVLGVIRQKD
jgi:hypothetical protein